MRAEADALLRPIESEILTIFLLSRSDRWRFLLSRHSVAEQGSASAASVASAARHERAVGVTPIIVAILLLRDGDPLFLEGWRVG